LKRVTSTGGGEAETLTTPDRARGEVRHAWPAFLPGGRAILFTIFYAVRGPERTLVWVDRQGREISLGMQAAQYVHPRLSPDGSRLTFLNAGNIWMWDISRSRSSRVTIDGGTISAWTPDAARVVFSSVRGGGGGNLYIQPADGTGATPRLTDSPSIQHPTGVTSDGTQLVFNESTPTQMGDIGLLTLIPMTQAKPLVATRFDERGGVVSPDGRWLAYESNRSGEYEIWVQPFPAGDGLWQVSAAGGVQPLWARNRQELFYVAPDGALMAVQWQAQGRSGRSTRQCGCSKGSTPPAAKRRPYASTMSIRMGNDFCS
jgi:Tol biopolymer transport system component